MSNTELSSLTGSKPAGVMPLTNDEMRIMYESLVLNRCELYEALREPETEYESEYLADLKTTELLIDRVAKYAKSRAGNKVQTVKQMDNDDGN